MKIIFLLIVCLSISSCSNKKNDILVNQDESTSTVKTYLEYFNDSKKVSKLMASIKKNGDTVAYYDLWKIYSLSGHREDYLHISLFMANKYKYKQAYFDVYENLNVLEKTIIKNTKDTKQDKIYLDFEVESLKNEYLKKAAVKGHLKAMSIIDSNKE